jgi:hypothetical protein
VTEPFYQRQVPSNGMTVAMLMHCTLTVDSVLTIPAAHVDANGHGLWQSMGHSCMAELERTGSCRKCAQECLIKSGVTISMTHDLEACLFLTKTNDNAQGLVKAQRVEITLCRLVVACTSRSSHKRCISVVQLVGRTGSHETTTGS